MRPAYAAARWLVAVVMSATVHTVLAQGADPQQTAKLQQVRELAQGGELDRAAAQADAYVQAYPRDPRGLFLKGVVLARQNRTDEAIAVYVRLTEEHPELPEPHNNLAALYAEQGRYEAAREALERAVRAQPSYAIAHENLGDIYARLAAQSYGRAAALDGARTSAQQKLKAVSEIAPPIAATTGAR